MMDDREAYEFYLDPANRAVTGPARRHPKDRLTKVISLRLSQSLFRRVANAAAQEGVPVGTWARKALRRELERCAREHRPYEVIEGSGRLVAPRGIPSSLSLGTARTFACPHLSISGVTSASCCQCGPLPAVA
jgi:hypothetical protein